MQASRRGITLELYFGPVIMTMVAMCFGTLWLLHSAKVAPLFWAAGYAIIASALIIENFVPKTPDTRWIRMLGDLCYVASPVVFSLGFFHHLKVKSYRWLPIVCGGLVVSAVLWFWLVNDSIQARAEVLSFGCAAILGLTAYVVARHARNRVDFALSGAIALSALLLVGNAFVSIRIFDQDLAVSSFNDSAFFEFLNFSSALINLAIAVVLAATLVVEAHQRLSLEAATDPLTGLNNRRAFAREAHVMVAQANASKSPLCLLVCDIDHFKDVNDTYGHDAGDTVIAACAALLKEKFSERELLARFGGEEFVVLMPYANATMARMQADIVRSLAEASIGAQVDRDLQVTLSFGVAERLDEEGFEALFKRADEALYQAKAEGRNRTLLSRSNLENTDLLNRDISVRA